MSIDAMRYVMRATVGSPGAKFVLLILADYADEKGSCWPEVSTICERTEQSDATVRRHLEWLEAEGWLTRKRLHHRDGSRAGYRYHLVARTVRKEGTDNRSKCAVGGAPPTAQNEDAYRSKRADNNPQETPNPSEANASSGAAPKPAKPKRKRPPKAKPPAKSTRCPTDWEPDFALYRWAAERGFDAAAVAEALAGFKDHEFPRAYSDWPATFRNWLRKEHPTRSPPHVKPANRHDERMAALVAGAQLLAGRRRPSDWD